MTFDEWIIAYNGYDECEDGYGFNAMRSAFEAGEREGLNRAEARENWRNGQGKYD